MDWMKVIAVFEILGGIHGLIQLAVHRSSLIEMQDVGMVNYVVFVFLLVMSIVAGGLLWFKQRRGFVYSIFIQFFQWVRFTFGPLNYGFNLLFSIGVYIRFLKQNSGVGINIEFFETYLYFYTKIVYKFNLYLPFDIVVNVSSMFLFFYLYFIYDRLFPMEAPYTLKEAA